MYYPTPCRRWLNHELIRPCLNRADDPAAQAPRQRIRARFTDLYTQRTTLETELAAHSPTPAPTTTPRDHHNQVPQAKITLAV